jgi:YgiT-type zinc finger domain-containing protein
MDEIVYALMHGEIIEQNQKGAAMTCFMCKGTVESKFSTFMADLGSCIVIVKNVPSQVCTQCGESSYSDEVAHSLEKIVQSITSTAATEIAVVNYSEPAA